MGNLCAVATQRRVPLAKQDAYSCSASIDHCLLRGSQCIGWRHAEMTEPALRALRGGHE